MPEGLHVLLKRSSYGKDRTLGWLEVYDGPIRVKRLACLELPWLMNAPRISCIPAGTYPLVLEMSARFKMPLWEIKDVPGRSECKVHAANFPGELNGCVAPGLIHADLDKDGKMDLASSRAARMAFHEALKDVTRTTITIVGDGRDKL